MTGRILIVDSVATNRILLKVRLSATFYDILLASSFEEATAIASAQQPDMIILDISFPREDGLQACAALRAATETAHIPIIALAESPDAALKLAVLRAGAEDLLTKPVDDQYLMARMRSVLRASDIDQELSLRDRTSRSLGLPDDNPQQLGTGRIALVGGNPQVTEYWQSALSERLAHEVVPMTRDRALAEASFGTVPDLFVIASDINDGQGAASQGLQLMSELRSRPATRHAAVVIVLPETDRAMAGISLDLGASDLVIAPFEMDEMAHRLGTQVARKRQSDRLRRRVEDGLKLAMTDPLTGLFNRRYALSHLAGVVDRARQTGRSFALMLLDLDRFKQVNDNFGHQFGDKVLREVAERLTSNLRSVDLVARVGGEEFLIVLPDTDAADARRTALRLCRTIENCPMRGASLTSGGKQVEVTQTASIGVAIGGDYQLPAVNDDSEMDFTATIERLLARADRALYRAKSSGRNGVMFSKTAAA